MTSAVNDSNFFEFMVDLTLYEVVGLVATLIASLVHVHLDHFDDCLMADNDSISHDDIKASGSRMLLIVGHDLITTLIRSDHRAKQFFIWQETKLPSEIFV